MQKYLASILVLSMIFLVGCASTPSTTPTVDQERIDAAQQALDDVESQKADLDKQMADAQAEAERIMEEYEEYELPEESSEQPKREYEGTLATVKGTSDGLLPYAPVAEEYVVSGQIPKHGGVVSTVMPEGGHVYVIIPPGEVIEDARVTISPYTEMPTGPNHPALSYEYGYGVQVEIDSLQRRIRAFVVFDTTDTKAMEQILSQATLFNRCDPRFMWFNPLICARSTGIAVDKLVDKEQAIVSPIHNPEYNHLVFTRHTIPTGIEGLIVAEVFSGDVYVPLKLDQAIAAQLVETTLGKWGNSPERLTASAYAEVWDIPLTMQQAETVVDSVYAADGYPEYRMAVVAGKNYALYAHSRADDSSEDVAEMWRTIAEDMEDAQTESAGLVIDTARSDMEDPELDYPAEGGALVGPLGSSTAPDGSGYCGGTEGVSDAGVDTVTSGDAPPDITVEVIEGLDEGFGPKTVESSDVANVVDGILNDASSSLTDVMNAYKRAQQHGLDREGKARERIKKKIENWIKASGTKSDVLQAGALAQSMGMESTADAAIEKARGFQEKECERIVKTLADFGVQDCLAAHGLSD